VSQDAATPCRTPQNAGFSVSGLCSCEAGCRRPRSAPSHRKGVRWAAMRRARVAAAARLDGSAARRGAGPARPVHAGRGPRSWSCACRPSREAARFWQRRPARG